MPLLVMSTPNTQVGADSPSRKRSHEDYLSSDAGVVNKVQSVTGVENIPPLEDEHTQPPQQQQSRPPPSPRSPTTSASPGSPLSPLLSGSPLSLLSDAGSSTPTRPSISPKPTPPAKLSAKPNGAPQQLVITIDAAMPSTARGGSATADAIDGGDGKHTTSIAAADTAAGSGPPPAKRKRLTPAEREEKAKADAARRQEKDRVEAAKKQERDEQRAALEARKKALAEEREKKRKQKEEEDRRRADEREKKRREKEDEERRLLEAKEKKERSQLRLNSFFKPGPGTTAAGGASPQAKGSAAASPAAKSISASPQKAPIATTAAAGRGGGTAETAAPATAAAAAAAAAAGATAEISPYDRMFKPFFVKDNVIVATTLYGMDEETKQAKARILDEHLSGVRGAFTPPRRFTATAAAEYFHLPCPNQHKNKTPRGRQRPSVRALMRQLTDTSNVQGAAETPQAALTVLRTVPMKYLAFREDVRPPYFGTITSTPPSLSGSGSTSTSSTNGDGADNARLAKLARNPLAKTVLPLNYDYDSEAEWVDDDGEDVDDLDDEEEELDEDGEMSDFLDDSEDAAPIRPAFSGGIEPKSSGLCWENEQQRCPLPELDAFRMEFIFDHEGALDPLSTHYWATPASDPPPPLPPLPLPPLPADGAPATGTPSTAMAPPPVPTDAFAVLGTAAAASGKDGGASLAPSSAAATAAAATGKTDPKKPGVAAEFVSDFKRAIVQYAKLSKVGIVEMLSVEFLGKCTKSQIKTSLEALAERTGPGQHKTWKLKDGAT
ncbi:chromatin assembly subunit-like protein [Niveomyces insectorum RCEF 264]|uniref:Chromatin assembly subunit-like protein n=1 Tax=Niveomyces insectorum RCEF 264 TaxID=1081102 RepID=A0A167QVH9_9HYPO|nr:chromatin assembly subunit-like protein [Niveomyces insectorum RCEF 264]